MAHFIPSVIDIAGFAQVLFAAFLFIVIGRTFFRNEQAEVCFFLGWGIVAAVVTLVCTLTVIPAYVPVIAVIVGSIVIHIRRKTWPLDSAELKLLGTALLAFIPFILILLAMEIWQSDSFAFWLPNLDYLIQNHTFPRTAGDGMASYFPLFPYGFQIAGYVALFPIENMKSLLQFNVLLHPLMAIYLARLISKSEAPNLYVLAGSVLLLTWANFGFVPAVAFASYGDVTSAFLAAICFHQAMTRSGRWPSAILALLLMLLVLIKQTNIVIAVLIVASSIIALWWKNKSPAGLHLLAATLIPAFVMRALWEWYVNAYAPDGANQLLPYSQWNFSLIPVLLGQMAEVALKKFGYFTIYVIVIAAALWSLIKGKRSEFMARLLAGAGVVLGFNLFLLFIYMAHYGGNFNSYWRYNTQAAIIMVVLLAPELVKWAKEKQPALFEHPKKFLLFYCVLVLLMAGELRYDIDPRKNFIMKTGEEVAAESAGKNLGLLTWGWNPIDDYISYRGIFLLSNRDMILPRHFKAAENPWAEHDALLVSCPPADFSPLAEAEKVTLLMKEGAKWRVAKTFTPPEGVCKRPEKVSVIRDFLCHFWDCYWL